AQPERSINIGMANFAVSIHREIVGWWWRFSAHIPIVRVSQAEIVAQLVGDRADAPVQQTIGASSKIDPWDRVEHDVNLSLGSLIFGSIIPCGNSECDRILAQQSNIFAIKGFPLRQGKHW